MTNAELGKYLARELFKLGSEHQRPCTRIQFMSGNSLGPERGQGGFAEAPLAGFLAQLLDKAPSHNGNPQL
jgi:hypothetical protein